MYSNFWLGKIFMLKIFKGDVQKFIYMDIYYMDIFLHENFRIYGMYVYIGIQQYTGCVIITFWYCPTVTP